MIIVWTIQKVMDEGTSEPFIARLIFGILNIRDRVIQAQISSQAELEPKRRDFDDLYNPVLESMFAMRKAATELRAVISSHRSKVRSGEIIGRQRNAIEIHESVNSQLQDELGRFLNSSVRAMKSLQKVTSHLGVDIGGFFAKEHNYQPQMQKLDAAGHGQLADYLRLARKEWSERLVGRRNALEHEGWTPDLVKYPIGADGAVQMVEPTIDSQPISAWVTANAAHVLAFVEDVLVYAFQRALPPELRIVEIPETSRDPHNPSRFRVTIPAVERVQPWIPRYDSAGFR